MQHLLLLKQTHFLLENTKWYYIIFIIYFVFILYKFKLDFCTPQFSRLIAFYVYSRLEANIAVSFDDNLDQTP